MKMKKIVLGIAGVAVIGVVCYFFLGASPGRALSWETTQVKRERISNMVSATGTVEPVTKVDVGTQVSGIVDKIYVDYNSVVKKGQLIAEMDKVTLQAELESQEAQLANAKAEYDYQQKNYARSKVLFEKKLISDTDYESATYNYEKAKSTYDKSKADIVKVRRNLGYAVITSPIDGVVISREVEEGQTVAAGFETPTLFTIAKDLTEMQVIADVDEADIGQVMDGQRVTFSVDAYPNDIFEGVVTQVRLEATVESNVVTYEVVISAPNPDLKLKPGLTATVSIYTLEKNGVLTISPKALKFVPDYQVAEASGVILEPVQVENPALQKTVWVKKGDTLEQKEVRLGTLLTSVVEVVNGLQEGEEVVIGMQTGKPAMGPPQTGETESSPFMPKPPGSDKKNKK
ncbi:MULTISPECIES: efflux RND transporter periplasmic adaptor subunit [Culturomica]|jgi:HlyD family secretion protein|uniref:efflux RND transporter periplasmic adaptor subunit n=1 Tax=Culturomica TaxID=1926651 RepID=UPI0008394535|nr:MULTISPECIES: efflux RND transporter periplasmic adaptor subunit [Odoribacteraceae]RHV98301.1 efflux RND transporter periplasmic adaptor subunit [Odoribacter sp. OF09-27XD]HBO26604.1 efflux RND transporter periplasmic adaptor subunit [Culturomica sp.]